MAKTYVRKCYNSSREGRVNIAEMHPRHLLNATAKKLAGLKIGQIKSDKEAVALLHWLAVRLDEVVYTAEDRAEGLVKPY
jgi:hypothetical protein